MGSRQLYQKMTPVQREEYDLRQHGVVTKFRLVEDPGVRIEIDFRDWSGYEFTFFVWLRELLGCNDGPIRIEPEVMYTWPKERDDIIHVVWMHRNRNGTFTINGRVHRSVGTSVNITYEFFFEDEFPELEKYVVKGGEADEVHPA